MPSDHVRESIEKAKQYLGDHPDEARYTDQPATAVMEDGLRCRIEHATGAVMITDMPRRVGGDGSAPRVDPERLRELVEWADHHSPVSDAIRCAVPTTVEVEPQ
jgi:hypothetical protein